MRKWDKKRSIMQRYDVAAHIYDIRYAEEQAAKIKAAFKLVKIGKNDYVLDAGCGTGLLFNHVADKTQMIIGLDISKKTLFEAKERARLFPDGYLVLADADNMPFAAGVFAAVFAITLIQNMPNPSKTLREIRRVAGNDANIVVTGMKKAFSRKSFEKLLEEGGLRINAIEDEGLKCYVAACIKLGF